MCPTQPCKPPLSTVQGLGAFNGLTVQGTIHRMVVEEAWRWRWREGEGGVKEGITLGFLREMCFESREQKRAVADLLVLAEGCRVPVLPALARGRLLVHTQMRLKVMLKGGGYMTARQFSLFGYSSLVVSVKGDWAVAHVCARLWKALRPYRISLEAESSLLAVNSALKGVPMLSVQPKGKQKGCAGCNRKIKDRYLLKALDKYWHEDCLKCACCDCRLGEVGSTLYTKANLILCRRDYLRLFGTTGNCAACSKLIPAFEMVMRARDNVYHLDCFACQLCNQRFCVGDKFFLKNNMILCQMDYEEGQLNGSFETQVQ
ncbi:unnamed protein product [Leuciscus chuanchicus]